MVKKVIVAYIPVLHQGYRQFFDANPEYHTLYILNDDVVDQFRPLQKDIRRLKPTLVRQALIGWNILDTIEVIDNERLQSLATEDVDILMPDEDICRDFAKEHFSNVTVTLYPIFLRWDRVNSNAEDPIDPDAVISTEQLHKDLIAKAQDESFKSADIWRRVGALVARDGVIISKSYNQAMPTSHSSWMNSDPRNNFGRGANIEMSTFMHAEARLIAEAAQKGTRLAGAEMYVTTFPCPPCAMLIANSGIKRLFYAQGYAVLEGKSVLQSRKVELIKVNAKQKADHPAVTVPYPDK